MGVERTVRSIRVALINDYEVVLAGLAHMLDRHRDRVEVIEITERARVDERVDVALYDTFGQAQSEERALARMVGNPRNRHVAVYTWSLQQPFIDAALHQGATGYLSKALAALELVEALERVAAGETVVSEPRVRVMTSSALDWPGRSIGLTDRESEVLALIVQGKPNGQIADLTHLSPNTIKSHIRAAYRKIGVTNRVEALIWGTDNGFRPDHRSVEHWSADYDAPRARR